MYNIKIIPKSAFKQETVLLTLNRGKLSISVIKYSCKNNIKLMILAYVIIFITLALIVLFGAHYLLYFSIINLFDVTSQHTKNTVLGVVFFLAISFILALALTMWKENIATRTFYFVSTLWYGLLVNLILAITVISIILLLSQSLGFNINTPALTTALFVLAIAFSSWGIWNAMHPKIKEISVTIPSLPDVWKGKKIVQLSDVHLGHVYQEGFMEKIVEKVNLANPEMVVITGDLLDGMDGNLLPLVEPLNNIQAKKGVYFVTGNHETYLGTSEVDAALKKTKVRIMGDEVIDLDGLKLIGINYPDNNENKNVVETLKNLSPDFKGQPNIFLYHAPTNINEFREAGINLMLSGHTHDGQIFPLNLITKLIFKGYGYGLKQLDEFTIYTTNGVGTWGPAMRTGNIPEIVAITLN